jgi:drug/metabolite transporter (DMT)-like permease
VKDARAFAGAARVTFALSLIATVILFGVALASGDQMLPTTPTGFWAIVAMAWISHVGGQGLLALALGRLPAVFSSRVIFLESIAAAIVAWLVFGEALTGIQGVGGALILAGIWTARPEREKT